MAYVEKTVLVNYSAAKMYALVEDVGRYPQFLPWCGGASVEARDEKITRATLFIDYHGIRQKFSTENTKEPPHRIDIKLLNGPFKHLDGDWRFIELAAESCKIEFRLQYEFSNKLLEKVVGPVFHYIANTFVDAFVKRAEQVYVAPK
ncbi:MAG: type II toxin-antitoxin system RatA family toxin [Burkholderiales bacterium]|nr:type II toxin-antitoxin system RatA family toxin [Burkholderiales bacterium]